MRVSPRLRSRGLGLGLSLGLSLGAALGLTAACQRSEARKAEPTTAPAAAPVAPVAATDPTGPLIVGRVSEGPTLTPTEALASLDANNGKVVRVAGTVKDVCRMRGCWMDIAGSDGATLRVKVKDGDVVFPVAALGKAVVAEGTLVKIPADPATDTASCGDDKAGHQHGAEHQDCARPAGAMARLDGVGATIQL